MNTRGFFSARQLCVTALCGIALLLGACGESGALGRVRRGRVDHGRGVGGIDGPGDLGVDQEVVLVVGDEADELDRLLGLVPAALGLDGDRQLAARGGVVAVVAEPT